MKVLNKWPEGPPDCIAEHVENIIYWDFKGGLQAQFGKGFMLDTCGTVFQAFIFQHVINTTTGLNCCVVLK